MSMYRRFYGPGSMARRLLDPRANLRSLWQGLTYLGMNLPAYRDEVGRFGKALGAS
jgi:hypothetical protein